jgi:hypothetical protein
LSDGSRPKRRLYVSMANDAPAYVTAFARLEADLARAKSPWLEASLERFNTEDHVTTVAPGLQSAIKRLFVKNP